MSNQQLAHARALITAKQYEEAKEVLRSLPYDPTAQKWLAKLEGYPVENTSYQNYAPASIQMKSPNLLPLYLFNVIIVLLLALLISGQIPVKVVVNEPIKVDTEKPLVVEGGVTVNEPVEINDNVPLTVKGEVAVEDPVKIDGSIPVEVIDTPTEVQVVRCFEASKYTEEGWRVVAAYTYEIGDARFGYTVYEDCVIQRNIEK